MSYILAFISIYLFNIPFGYWRGNVRKFSPSWFAAVHVPVLFVIFVRHFGGFGWEWFTFPIFVSAFFLGQLSGSSFFNFRKERSLQPLTSCLVMDLVRREGKH